jgi:putative oxidoreductase
MTLKRAIFGTAVEAVSASAGLIILRMSAGLLLALAHGMGKVPPQARFVSGVEGMGFPAPDAFAWASAVAEFFGGLFVAIGLMTRPAALLAAINMGVAFFIAHSPDPFQRKELALMFMCAMLCLAFTGAGRFSFDFLIAGRSRKNG